MTEIGQNGNDQVPIELIGLFKNIRHTGEHNYGYSLSLWKFGEKILGFFNHYEGSLEPDRTGSISTGSLNNGNLQFAVRTKQAKGFEDWEQSDLHIYSFVGHKINNKITGRFSRYDCANTMAFTDSEEQVELRSSDMWELKSFKNIKDWKANYRYQLDQGK